MGMLVPIFPRAFDGTASSLGREQPMRLGWKVLLPISLVWVFLVSGYIMLRNDGMLPW